MTAADLPPPPKKRRRIWPWVLLALLVVFVTVPAIRAGLGYSDRDSDSPSLPVGVEGALGASDELSAHDQDVIAGLGSYVQRFNAAALPLVTKYNDITIDDPTTTFNERAPTGTLWAFSARRHIKEMYAATIAMRVDILSIEDDGVRESLLRIEDTMRDEVNAMVDLQSAVPFKVKAERRALRQLQRAAAQRQQLGIELLDRLRPYVDPATLREILQSAAERAIP